MSASSRKYANKAASKSLALLLAALLAGIAVVGYEFFQITSTTTSLTTAISTTTATASPTPTLTITNISGTLTTKYTSTGTLTSVTTTSGTIPSPIKHVVVIMQENRPFDNFFWTWPGQIGYNASLCMPLNPTNPSCRLHEAAVHDEPRIRGRPAAHVDLVVEIVQQRLDERISDSRGRQSGSDELTTTRASWETSGRSQPTTSWQTSGLPPQRVTPSLTTGT